MKTEILKMLKETDRYVSGQQLCGQFGVSRTAVWKIIGQLKKEGYQIQAVRNKGYRLVESADVITGAELESLMNTAWAGTKLEYYDETDSTNIRARQLAEKGAPHGTLVTADSQTAGKGRRGRSWIAPRGQGIWMSLVLRPDIDPQNASMLTLVAALAVSDGIKKSTGLDVSIKWPNDVVCRGRKLCGILTEMSTEADWIRYCVVGMGINVNMETFPEELKDQATSLCLELKRPVKRSPVICACMEAFETYYGIFIKTGDLSALTETYNGLSANLARTVTVLDPAGEYRGEALGIDSRGCLLVKCSGGEIRRVISGEVSVRGICGYV